MVLDLGIQPLANNLLAPNDLDKPEPKFPLRLAVCESCWLLQIVDIVPPVQLFSEYLYFSSASQEILRHAQQAAARYLREFDLGPQSFVVEIASNDGYFLRNFSAARVPHLGIEPAANIARVAQAQGIETLNRFFDARTAQEIVTRQGPADLILGNNVFAHAPEPNDFVAGLRILLKDSGRILLEFPYAADLIEHTEFDTIYHEHVFYFTLTALAPLFERHGLAIFHVERLPMHGGSLRLFVSRSGAHAVRTCVADLLAEEKRKQIPSLNYYLGFTRQVDEIRSALVALLRRLKTEGHRIAAYGASAKGSTLLNFCGLGRETIDFIVDRSAHKQGRLTPGTHVPILGVEELIVRQPAYALLLTWNFADDILAQQHTYRERGGRFIVPVPKVKIV